MIGTPSVSDTPPFTHMSIESLREIPPVKNKDALILCGHTQV